MTWAQIGKEMGVSPQCAWAIGAAALRKLRRHPGAVEALRQMEDELDELRNERAKEGRNS